MNENNEFLNVQELKIGMVITKDVIKNGKSFNKRRFNC